MSLPIYCKCRNCPTKGDCEDCTTCDICMIQTGCGSSQEDIKDNLENS